MKEGIHPTWYPDAVVVCSCGSTWTTGSTKKEIHTDVCNQCHPFYTGEQRIVDTAGQVERFMKRISAKEQLAAAQPAPEEKKSKKDKRRDRQSPTTPVTAQAPAELPLAVIEEKPVAVVVEPVVVKEPPAPAAKVEEPVIEVAAPVAVIAEPVAEVIAPVVAVEEPVAEVVSEPAAEEPVVVAPVVEEPIAPVAVIEEPVASVVVVEEPEPVAEPTPIAKVYEAEAPVISKHPEPVAVVEQTKSDDLEIIEGIGPKIATALQDAGIKTFAQLAGTSVEKLRDVLQSAQLSIADPGTWSEQAQLAADGKMDELKKLQDELVGGRRVEEKPAKARVAKKPAAGKKPAAKATKPKATATKKPAAKSKASTTKKAAK